MRAAVEFLLTHPEIILENVFIFLGMKIQNFGSSRNLELP